jgi:hypothetical protein
LVTPYGDHSAAHAAGTWSIAVVVVTDAQAPEAALGRADAVAVAATVGREDGAGLPQADSETTVMATAPQPREQPIRTPRALPPQPASPR